MFMTPYRKFKNFNKTYSLDNWPALTDEDNLSYFECVEVTEHLKLNIGLSVEKELWNRDKIDEIKANSQHRKRRYQVTSALSQVSFIIAMVFSLAHIFVSSTNTLLLALGAALASVLLLLDKRSSGRNLSSSDISQYFSTSLSQEQAELLDSEIRELLSSGTQFFVRSYKNHLNKIPVWCLSEGNAFLIFTGLERDRAGILLLEHPPVGPILMKRPKAKVKIQSNKPETQGEKTKAQITSSKYHVQEETFNRNLRSSSLQKKYLSRIKDLEATLEEIYRKYPVDPISGVRKLNKARVTRLIALEYLRYNPEFWVEISNLETSTNAPSREFAKHKSNIREIFSNISKTVETKDAPNPATDMTKDFLKLKDRTLEMWLNEIFIAK